MLRPHIRLAIVYIFPQFPKKFLLQSSILVPLFALIFAFVQLLMHFPPRMHCLPTLSFLPMKYLVSFYAPVQMALPLRSIWSSTQFEVTTPPPSITYYLDYSLDPPGTALPLGNFWACLKS